MADRTHPRRSIRGFLVPAHGGSGVSTLARHQMVRPSLAERSLAQVISCEENDDVAVVVMASATTAGTSKAVRSLHQLELAGVEPRRLYLAVVRDGHGPMPTAARSRLRLLSSVVNDIFVLPYVLRWRYEGEDHATPSRRYDRAVEEVVVRITTSHTPGRSRLGTTDVD